MGSTETRLAALEALVNAQDDALRRLIDLLQRSGIGGPAGADSLREARAQLQEGMREAARRLTGVSSVPQSTRG